MKTYYPIKYERTDYAREIRKAYDRGEIYVPMNVLREPTIDSDGIARCITTVTKDLEILEVEDIDDG